MFMSRRMSLSTATPSPTPTQLPSETPTQPTTQTQPPTTTPTTGPTDVGGVSGGAIAGGVIGGLIGVAIIVLIIIVVAYLIWRAKNSPSKCDHCYQYSTHVCSLVSWLLPRKAGREPGRFDHVARDIACKVLRMILTLSPFFCMGRSLGMSVQYTCMYFFMYL